MKDEDYHEVVERTAQQEGVSVKEQRSHFALGLAGEAGEVADLVKKDVFYPHKDVLPERILDEAGDVLWYLAALVARYGFTLTDVKEYNKRKLEERYPDGFPK